MQIISRPQPKAVFSLFTFSVLCWAIAGYSLRVFVYSQPVWYHYLAVYGAGGVGLLLFIRQLISYKIVTFTDKTVSVRHPFTGKKKQLPLKLLVNWKETIIATKVDPYKQLELFFDAYTVRLSVQENTHYEQIRNYFKKRWPKKEKK